jgi:hypothetical protein
MKFIPENDPKGGSLVGNSYLSSFATCPRRWFNSYYRPFEGSKGIRAQFISEHLIKGSTFHEAIAELYLSGCQDGEDTGEWNLDRAVAKLEIHHASSVSRYASEEKADEDKILLTSMIIAYYDQFSLNGAAPDYPTIRVMHDGAGEPLIEREFKVDLANSGYVFTCRADLLIHHHGYPKVMEHKTSAPGFWAQKRLNAIHTDSQFTGECFVLASLFPGEQIDGVLCNVVIKKGKTKIAIRESTRRDHHDFNTFRLSALDILQQIDHRTEGFSNDLDAGYPEEEAINRWFPDHGTKTGACENYGGCEFQVLCRNKDRVEANLKTFRPRTQEQTDQMKEWTG